MKKTKIKKGGKVLAFTLIGMSTLLLSLTLTSCNFTKKGGGSGCSSGGTVCRANSSFTEHIQ